MAVCVCVCGGGYHYDNGVAKGAGTTSGKGEGECACNEPGACMSSSVGSVRATVRACACTRARVGGGGGRLEYYGLSVAEVTMQSPV